MGPKPNKAKLQKQKKQAATNKNVETKQLTSEEYIVLGEKFACEYKFDKALTSFESALKLDPTNTLVMDTIGEILIENGKIEKAKTYFVKSIQTNPEDSATKYMNLGQLVGGDDALKCYNKGVEIMERDLKELIKQSKDYKDENYIPKPLANDKGDGVYVENEMDEDEDQQQQQQDEDEDEEQDPIIILKQQLCSALCSISELYLTDQCFDDNAETECERNLKKAIKYSPHSPEPYSLMASMKISQEKNQEAIEYLTKSYTLWENSDVDDRPEFDYRFNISLLFIELKQNRVAVDILEQLVNEQDNIAELWYTLGVVYNNLVEPLSAQECLLTAQDLLKIAAKHDRDEELENLTSTLLEKVDKDVSLLPPDQLNGDDDEEEGVDEEDLDEIEGQEMDQ